jgi:Ser/Thr protein kinase RdoA (MazF antagonist)
MARLDWRIIDIIGAWSRFCYNKFGFRHEKKQTFLAAYQSEMSLSHSELAQIPNAWAYSYMWQTILNWYQYCHHNQSHSLSQANIYWQRVLWLRENEDKLASVIG